MTSRFYCKECGHNKLFHFRTWFWEIRRHFVPHFRWARRLVAISSRIYVKALITTGFGKFTTDFENGDLAQRSHLFLQAMTERGARCSVLKTRLAYMPYFKVEVEDTVSYFRVLPTAGFLSSQSSHVIVDKVLAKEHFRRGNFPVAASKAFWFWQKQQAKDYFKELNAPVVVKPRGGSVSRHVTTDIRTSDHLQKAIQHALTYGPAFIIEQFIPNAYVHRATVIDFDFVVCVQQVPANVVGDGLATIRQLIDRKNEDPRRGTPSQKAFTLNKLVEDKTTVDLLQTKGYTVNTVPTKGEVVFLQRDPFLKLGGDLVEVTSHVHPDNLRLFRDIARHFDIRITGIDFLAPDITVSWKNQLCAILELNSLPCIELHHYPSTGKPTNPHRALADMFFKYYVHSA